MKSMNSPKGNLLNDGSDANAMAPAVAAAMG
jgi:hypothetical protein